MGCHKRWTVDMDPKKGVFEEEGYGLFIDLFHQPRHVGAKRLHGHGPFLVALHIAGASPIPIFQYHEPGTTIWLMKKKWFIVSNAWMAPARRTATTDAPTFLRNMSWLAFATKPARLIRAFISSGHVSKIRRRCKDNPVSIQHFFYTLVEDIVFHRAPFILVDKTFPTGGTALDLLSRQTRRVRSGILLFSVP